MPSFAIGISQYFSIELASLAQDRVEFDGLYAESPNQTLGDMVSLLQVRWQGAMGEILEEELMAVISKDGEVVRLEHQSFADLLKVPLPRPNTAYRKTLPYFRQG
jgi:hypothetical protein